MNLHGVVVTILESVVLCVGSAFVPGNEARCSEEER